MQKTINLALRFSDNVDHQYCLELVDCITELYEKDNDKYKLLRDLTNMREVFNLKKISTFELDKKIMKIRNEIKLENAE